MVKFDLQRVKGGTVQEIVDTGFKLGHSVLDIAHDSLDLELGRTGPGAEGATFSLSEEAQKLLPRRDNGTGPQGSQFRTPSAEQTPGVDASSASQAK